MRTIRQELLSRPAALNVIERRAGKISTDGIEKEFSDIPSQTIGRCYSKVESIDNGFKKGLIVNKTKAKTERKAAVSKTLNLMVRHRYIDSDILEAEGILVEDIYNRYITHEQRTKFIQGIITDYRFIRKAIAEKAKPYLKFTHEELDKLTRIDNEIKSKENAVIREDKGSFFYPLLIPNLLKQRTALVNNYESSQGKSIESVCCRITNQATYYQTVPGKTIPSLSQKRNPFEDEQLYESLWNLSPSSQTKLIEFIVSKYKSYYHNDIKEYYQMKERRRKQAWNKKQRKKKLSASEKHQLVLWGKADGYSKPEVSEQIGCSLRTVQHYWNKQIA